MLRRLPGSFSNADDLRNVVRDYALASLADPDAVLVIDETGFLKQGHASCGVARQYTGSAGKITNQSGLRSKMSLQEQNATVMLVCRDYPLRRK